MTSHRVEFAARIGRISVYPTAAGYGDRAAAANLASNESPEPPMPEVLAAIERALGSLHRYPDPAAGRLRERLAGRYGVPVARIAVGNGSCDLLLAAGEALLEPGAEVVYGWPSFSVYPHLAAAAGARAVAVPLDDAERLDLDTIAAEITAATRLVIVCNPNNPTSTALPLEAIEAMLGRIPPHVAVVLDEAYCEFNLLADPDDSIALLAGHPNLMLLRTFSKVYGLCGLRIGFALCGSEALKRALDKVRQPFSCNALAQAAAIEALAHTDEVTRRVERTLARRIGLQEGLAALGLKHAESQANFVWVTLPEWCEEDAIVAGLSARGVLVRAGGALGRERALRVTVGTERENRLFLEALAELLAQPQAA
ncbi:MAG: histidinol-phosphate transaminase [Solirubrobacteraceae bacterium]